MTIQVEHVQENLGGFAGFVHRFFGLQLPEPRPRVEVRPTAAPPLYPQRFAEFIGQPEMKLLLQTEVLAAKRTGRPLAHLLFYGPPGLGKTAIAHVLAGETDSALYESSGPEFPDQPAVFQTLDDIVALWQQTGRPVVWLVDEIDGMARAATYAAHGLLTHGYATWRGHKLYQGLPVSLIGTSNFLSSVPGALKSRFAEILALDYYQPSELAIIAQQSAIRLGLTLTQEALDFVGANAAGEPRKVNLRLLRNVSNLTQGTADLAIVRQALRLSGLRPLGLSRAQFLALEFLEKMPKQTAGLSSIAAKLMTGVKDIQSEVEAYLIYRGYLLVTPRGRQLSLDGTAYLEFARKEMMSW